MTESHPTLDDLVATAHCIEAKFSELLDRTDPGHHTVRYVGIEAATFAEFVEQLNAAHDAITAEGDEYGMSRHVPVKKGESWGALLTVVRGGPRSTVAPDEARP